jgi:hypothetical protein
VRRRLRSSVRAGRAPLVNLRATQESGPGLTGCSLPVSLTPLPTHQPLIQASRGDTPGSGAEPRCARAQSERESCRRTWWRWMPGSAKQSTREESPRARHRNQAPGLGDAAGAEWLGTFGRRTGPAPGESRTPASLASALQESAAPPLHGTPERRSGRPKAQTLRPLGHDLIRALVRAWRTRPRH